MRFGFGMRLTPLAGFGLVLGYSRERGFLFDQTFIYSPEQVVKEIMSKYCFSYSSMYNGSEVRL